MVSIPTGLAINTATAGDRVTALGFRSVFASLFRQSAPGTPIAGIIQSGGSVAPLDVQTSTSLMTYHVNPGFAVTTRSNQGAYVVGTAAAAGVTVTVAAGDATNPRYDRVYIVQPDPELSESGTARIDVAVGTAAAAPSLPALPNGALELARKLVPAGAVSTGVGTALTNKAPYTSVNAAANISDVNGLQTALDGKRSTSDYVGWGAINAVPAAITTLAAGTIDDANLPIRLSVAPTAASGSWDSVTSSGWHKGNGLTNSPLLGSGDNWYYVFVIQHDSSWCVQTAWGYVGVGANRMFTRQKQNNVWTGWRELQSATNQLTNGGHVFSLNSDGTLTLDGAQSTTNTLISGGYQFQIDNTGRVYATTTGTTVPIWARTYSTDGHGSSSAANLASNNSGTIGLAIITSSGTLGRWFDRLDRTYMPFDFDGGTTDINVSSSGAGTGYYAGSKTVTFNSTRMGETPDAVTATVHSGALNEAITCTVGSINSTSFTVTMRRASNTTSTVSWHAYANRTD